LHQIESARSTLDAAIRLALAGNPNVTLDGPDRIGARVIETMAAVTTPADPLVSSWVCAR
jgi:hypothetical protein